tara:strand:- start:6432 stop:7424 length:993 start_codon:yes stop_codon:yes gene_type:complete
MSEPITVVIFVQASRDIVYALQLIEVYSDSPIKLFVVDHLANYEMLKPLIPARVSIHMIRNFKFNNPLYVLIDAMRLRGVFIKQFLKLRSSKVFFFSNFFDYKTFYFVSELSKKNDVSMIDHYGVTRSSIPSLSLIDYIRKIIIWLITFKAPSFTGEAHVPTFNIERYGIKKVDDVEIVNSLIAKYQTKVHLNQKSIILFDLIDPEFLFSNYDDVIDSVIELFINAGFLVYIKPHPRAKISESLLSRSAVHMFESNKPSELIDFSNFDYAVTAISAAMCKCGVTKKLFSLVELLDFHNSDKKDEYKNYLKELDENIVFPITLSDIKLELA